MSFSTVLNEYLDACGCTAKELAEISGVSASSISRYLSGDRVPGINSDVPAKLAKGLASYAKSAEAGGAFFSEGAEQAGEGNKGTDGDAVAGNGSTAPKAEANETTPKTDLSAEAIEAELVRSLTGIEVGYDAFAGNFRQLMETLGINGNRLAHSLGFDPSYISRIQAGKRRPANLPHFIDGVATYVARNFTDNASIAQLAALCGSDAIGNGTPPVIAHAVRAFLGSNPQGPDAPEPLEHLLAAIDEFDLNTYLRNVHFDEIKVPTVPFQLPTVKTYTGIEEMKQAELDFLKAAVLSKSVEDIILYSDMPLEEMAADKEFTKNVMIGMGMLIKKGVHLQNIHDVNRPLNELIMGLEGWFPLYMTGQISPYYLKYPTNTAFLHFLRSAGTVAVSGEAISGNQASGRYIVTRRAADVAYYRQRAQQLLSLAKPLLQVFREGDEAKLEATMRRLEGEAKSEPIVAGEGTFENMTITVWPKSHALIRKENAPSVTMIVEYPALVDALEHYEPTLF